MLHNVYKENAVNCVLERRLTVVGPFSHNKSCFGQKEQIKVQFFRLLRALIKVHPVPHTLFEATRSKFIQILYHCSVSWKITSFCIFLLQTLYTLDKKSPSKRNFQTFEWLGKNSPNSSCHIWNHKSVFL